MKRFMAISIAALCLCANAEQEVFRLVRDTTTGATAVVGVDGVLRQCHILSDDEYHYVTNMVGKWYEYMNMTKDGRSYLHGAKEGKTVVTTNEAGVITKLQRYSDGYVHSETAVVKERPTTRPRLHIGLEEPREVPKRTIRHPAGISAKQREMREARERVRQKKPKEITVNHDANTGKDTVVK